MKERRHMLLAWGLLLSIIASVAVVVWLPLMDEAERHRTRVGSLSERVGRVQGLASTKQQLTEAVAQLRQSIGSADSNQFVVARSPTLGAAELQRRIQQIISASNARQLSSQPLAVAEVANLHKLQVTVNFSGDLRSLHDVLYGLKSGQPRIFVERLLVSGKSNQRARRARARRQQNAQLGVSNAGQQLSVRLMAAAYMQIGDGSDAQTALR